MNLLLDTQTLLWFVLDDPRLSKKARKNIVAIDTVVFVSPASLWEIAIKISLGKYALPASFATCWYDQLLTNDFVLLPISVSHCKGCEPALPSSRSFRSFDHCSIAGRRDFCGQ